MDRDSYPINPYFLLFGGILLLATAVISSYKGKVLTRRGRYLYRDEEPFSFVCCVGISYIGAGLLIGLFLHEVL